MPPLFRFKGFEVNIPVAEIAESVGIYPGIPFAIGMISRYGPGRNNIGKELINH
ncbi:hypothetical protein [Pedobacter sp. MC2016-15]|uniref:hypothetical protein n=1 Tax=Pedobacter sp. MC2016-15 TaxID=2994473 RepID=UPI002B2422E3|nr:hypothetical protein [Pedobacter sp. MC2016-15]